MDISSAITPQSYLDTGSLGKLNPPQSLKPGDGESFGSIYNLGLNGLKSAVSEASEGYGIREFVEEVDAARKHANDLRADALSGGSTSLHQAMIASEEASVSFTLLVEMRNKLLETYQELMRMQV